MNSGRRIHEIEKFSGSPDGRLDGGEETNYQSR